MSEEKKEKKAEAPKEKKPVSKTKVYVFPEHRLKVEASSVAEAQEKLAKLLNKPNEE